MGGEGRWGLTDGSLHPSHVHKVSLHSYPLTPNAFRGKLSDTGKSDKCRVFSVCMGVVWHFCRSSFVSSHPPHPELLTAQTGTRCNRSRKCLASDTCTSHAPQISLLFLLLFILLLLRLDLVFFLSTSFTLIHVFFFIEWQV